MYEQHFGLDKKPFEQTPDSEFLYLSEQHGYAVASMKFAIANRDAFVIVTGEIGSGKTTMLNKVFSEMDEGIAVARVNNTQLSDVELLRLILADFGINAFRKKKAELIYELQQFVQSQHQAGRQVVLMIDEAQNLSAKVLEQLRLLTCLETEKVKLVTVLLLGQPELNRLIDAPSMEQLRQRCRLRLHMEPLAETDIEHYMRHRLEVAGGDLDKVFQPDVPKVVYRHTQGIPRLINTLCDTALTACAVGAVEQVTTQIIEDVVEELQWHRVRASADQTQTASLTSESAVHIVMMKGDYLINEHSVTAPTAIIGRARDCEVVVPDVFCSRRHAMLSREGVMWTIADLNSTNGTRVNGRAIRQHTIADGDIIELGEYTLECKLVPASAEFDAGPPTLGEDDFVETLVYEDAGDAGPPGGPRVRMVK
jgi:type II secretory pathway predicted ATPase ExeA